MNLPVSQNQIKRKLFKAYGFLISITLAFVALWSMAYVRYHEAQEMKRQVFQMAEIVHSFKMISPENHHLNTAYQILRVDSLMEELYQIPLTSSSGLEGHLRELNLLLYDYFGKVSQEYGEAPYLSEMKQQLSGMEGILNARIESTISQTWIASLMLIALQIVLSISFYEHISARLTSARSTSEELLIKTLQARSEAIERAEKYDIKEEIPDTIIDS